MDAETRFGDGISGATVAKVALAAVAGVTLVVAIRRKSLSLPRATLLLFQVAVGIGEVWQEKRLRRTLSAYLEDTGALHAGTE